MDKIYNSILNKFMCNIYDLKHYKQKATNNQLNNAVQSFTEFE